MADIKAILSKKIGPLPAGAWALIVVGGATFAYYVRDDSEAADVAYVEEGEDPYGQGGNTATNPGAGGAIGGGGGSEADPYDDLSTELGGYFDEVGGWFELITDEQGETRDDLNDIREDIAGLAPKPETDHMKKARGAPGNPAWVREVRAGLIAQGYRPALVASTIERWFQGKQLNAQQRAAITQALAQAGPPPRPPKQSAGPKNRNPAKPKPRPAGTRDQGKGAGAGTKPKPKPKPQTPSPQPGRPAATKPKPKPTAVRRAVAKVTPNRKRK